MKKLYLSILATVLLTQISYAQWTTTGTNTTTTNTVGIGTSSPQSNVEITSGSYSSGNQLIISGGEPTRYYGVMESTMPAGHTLFSLGTKSNYANYFQTLNLVNGNVGIGTTNPYMTLDANSTVAGVARFNTSATGNTSNVAISNNSNWNYGVMGVVSGTGVLNGDVYGLGYISDANASFTPVLNWTSTGSVGIGTTNPQGHKLAVNGDIIATSVTVKLYADWPDYVFKPTYNLKPLSEVKTYIDLNHHLPEMPSEKEVADKGVDLGEINKLLTKKVEELTLYLIEKDKELKEQQNAIMQINNQMTQLLSSKKSKANVKKQSSE